MKRFHKKKIYTQKTKKGKFRIIIWIVISLLILSQIFLTIQSSTKGLRLSELENIESNLIEDGEKLKNELVALSSVTDLQERASDLGFVEIEETMYVKVGESFAGITR